METSQRAKCSGNHPPSGFHGDGAGRWSSGAPAAADVACAGLAWGGRRGGAAPWDVAGPGLSATTSPGLWVRHLREASWIPQAGAGGSWLTFCSPPSTTRPGARPS